jgi:hypothetical protein
MTVPAFLLAALWQRFDLGRRRWLRGRELRVGPLRLHTTSTLSGLLFVGVGVLFLVADGTAGLVGLPPESAARAEDAVTVLGARVPDGVLLAVLALAVVAVTVWRVRRAR